MRPSLNAQLRVARDRTEDLERAAAAARSARGPGRGIRFAVARRLLRIAARIEPRVLETLPTPP